MLTIHHRRRAAAGAGRAPCRTARSGRRRRIAAVGPYEELDAAHPRRAGAGWPGVLTPGRCNPTARLLEAAYHPDPREADGWARSRCRSPRSADDRDPLGRAAPGGACSGCSRAGHGRRRPVAARRGRRRRRAGPRHRAVRAGRPGAARPSGPWRPAAPPARARRLAAGRAWSTVARRPAWSTGGPARTTRRRLAPRARCVAAAAPRWARARRGPPAAAYPVRRCRGGAAIRMGG